MDALEASLSGLAPDLRVSLRTEMKDFVTRMLDDRLKAARETRLTWDQRKVRARRPLGTQGLDLLREHVSIARGTYFIQNCKLYSSNGSRITFDDVNPSLRAKVEESFGHFLEQAVKSDPGLCKHCLAKQESFTTDNHEEYAEHLLFMHPEVLAAKLGTQGPPPRTATVAPPQVSVEEVRPKPKPQPPPEPEPFPVERPAPVVATSDTTKVGKDLVPGEFVCHLCGYLGKTERSLRMHKTHKHINRP